MRVLNGDDEQPALFAAAPTWFRALMTVGFNTVTRRGELLNAKWADLDETTRPLHIRHSKSGEGRYVPLPAEAWDALMEAKRERNILSPYIFCTPSGKPLHNNFARYWRRIRKEAGVSNVRFHDLRHTTASRLADKGVPLYTIQLAGGWKSPRMVQRYAHLDPEHLRKALGLLSNGANPTATATGTITGTNTLTVATEGVA